jgi:hypothetical protein
MMRIGTWNLAGRWSTRHKELLERAGCEVWLLTEVPEDLALDGGELIRSEAMPRTSPRSWAAVWSDEPVALWAPPHPAAAVARRNGVLFCSCMLPWRSGRGTWPDPGSDVAGETVAALARLRPALTSDECPVVWGGDWNHAMDGQEYAGSPIGRDAIQELVSDAGLAVATAGEPHAIDGLLSIDHIAVPEGWRVESSRRVVAEAGGERLSDHDAYVVDIADVVDVVA